MWLCWEVPNILFIKIWWLCWEILHNSVGLSWVLVYRVESKLYKYPVVGTDQCVLEPAVVYQCLQSQWLERLVVQLNCSVVEVYTVESPRGFPAQPVVN